MTKEGSRHGEVSDLPNAMQLARARASVESRAPGQGLCLVYTLSYLTKMETKLLPVTSVLPISHSPCSWVLLLLNGLHFLKMASFSFAMPSMTKKLTEETIEGHDSHGFPSSPYAFR